MTTHSSLPPRDESAHFLGLVPGEHLLRPPAPLIQSFIWVSDLHAGSTVGLWPHRHEIEGGGVYEANKAQGWLLECWQDCIWRVQQIHPKPILIINGDPIQGTNSRDGQIIGATVSAQVGAALDLLAPLAAAGVETHVIRGTEWHEGKASENVELLARLLGTKPDPETGQYSRWEILLDVGGQVIHSTHHIGTSSVPWYEATVPLRDASQQLSEYARFYGPDAPNVRLVARSHRHRFVHVMVPPNLQVFVTPAWQLKTAFAHKKASNMLPEIGFVLVEWDGEEFVVKPRIYALPAPRLERAVWPKVELPS